MRFFFILLSIITLHLKAQDVIVVDKITQSPIEGTNIFSKTQQNGIISNGDGFVSLSIFKKIDTLIIQHISYKTILICKGDIKRGRIYLELKQHTLENINIKGIKSKLIAWQSISSTITAKEIKESQNTQTSDLLEGTIGLSIQKSQNGGGSPNLRGMEANRLLIIVDGIPLNTTIFRSGHVQNSATINPIFLESAEVLFGPASVAYGNGAMGGVLVFNTINPKNKTYNQFIQQYESASNAVLTSYLANYALKSSVFTSGFSIKLFGNLKMGNNRIHGFNDWGNESTITDKNIQLETAYHQEDFFHKSLIKLTNHTFLLFNTQYAISSNINRFDKLNDTKEGERKYSHWYYGPQKRFFQSIRLKNYTKKLLADESVITLAYQNLKESRHKQKTGEELLSNRSELLDIFDFKSDFMKQYRKLKLNYGIDFRYQNLESAANLSKNNNLYYNTTRYPDDGTQVTNYAIYSQVNYPVNKKLNISIGSRYNMHYLAASFKDTAVINLHYSEINVTNYSLSNSLQLLYKINPHLIFNTSLSNGFRNPNTDDIAKIFSKNDISVVVPNNKLKPEKSLNIEAGVQTNFWNQSTIQIQWFQTYITDAIERRSATLNALDSIEYDNTIMRVMMNTNIGAAKINGLNFTYNIHLNKSLSNRTIINLIKGESADGLPLAHIPPTNIVSTINYIFNKDKLSFSVYYNSLKKASEYDIGGVDNLEEGTSIGNPSWYTLNLRYKKTIDPNLSFIVGVQNILDAHYKTFGSGISSSGRHFIVSLQTAF